MLVDLSMQQRLLGTQTLFKQKFACCFYLQISLLSTEFLSIYLQKKDIELVSCSANLWLYYDSLTILIDR